jgi:mannosyltransferase
MGPRPEGAALVTSPGIQPVAAQAAAAAGGGGSEAWRRPGFSVGTAWMLALPGVATLVITLWGITGASYWRDEAATMSAAQRPLGNLLRTLGNIDAVHGAYYLLIWVMVKLGGTGELATRLPSAVAMAVAAVAVAALGGRLVSSRAGLAAGLVFAVLPPVSLYGQDARPYAITVALAAIASYLLVRAMEADVSGKRYKWLAGYAASVAALGVVDIFGLLLIVAHAVTVGLRCLRLSETGASWAGATRTGSEGGPGEGGLGGEGGPGGGRSVRSLAVAWLAAAVAGAALASPLLAFAFVQRGTLSWLTAPSLGAVRGLHELIGPAYMADAVVLGVACGIVVSALLGRERLRASWPGSLPALCLPWLIVPPVILLVGSLITPLYTFRYVLLCIPAIALLAGAGLASLGWVAGAAALVVIALLGLPQQRQVRGPDGHGDNVRQADRIVAEHMLPKDAVLEFKAENFAQAYPYGIRKLAPVALAKSPIRSATLIGTFLPDPVVRERLTHVQRVWVVEYGHPAPLVILNGLHFQLVHAWQTSDIWLYLYAQSPGANSG